MLCGVLFGATLQPAKAAEAFPDVPSNHWAYSTIQWAVDNDVVNGYPDGTFRPSQHVTEAEFLVMFIRAFDELPKVTQMTHWADPAYLYAEEKNWPIMGAGNHELRGRAISREQVAEIIAGANGVNFLGTDAIEYVLNTGLSKGKTDATVEGYKGGDFLTRAEAVQFIKNLKDKGLRELQKRPELPTPKDQMPKPKDDANLPAKVREVKAKMEEVVSKDYPNYVVGASETGVTIAKGTLKGGNGSVSFRMGSAKGGLDLVISYKATEEDSLHLAVEMLKAVGVPVKDDFFDTLKDAGGKNGRAINPEESSALFGARPDRSGRIDRHSTFLFINCQEKKCTSPVANFSCYPTNRTLRTPHCKRRVLPVGCQ